MLSFLWINKKGNLKNSQKFKSGFSNIQIRSPNFVDGVICKFYWVSRITLGAHICAFWVGKIRCNAG